MQNIRNFCIISHIDHGKSTLADRFLEMTGTVRPDKMKPQFLDRMELEREKGITIKLKPVRMNYRKYVLNLVDTPGHVDFSYEVSRALAAVEGAILLVDATQGIQAQTLANLELAKKQGLVIIPAVNKIDAPDARIEESAQEIANILNIDPNSVLKISGKLGTNVDALLDKVIKEIPAPKTDNQKPFRALIFDSDYDSYKGVIAYVRVVDGEINAGEKIRLLATNTEAETKEIGYFMPGSVSQRKISAGEIGYIATGIKEPDKVRVGDTITTQSLTVEPLVGYQEPKSMVFASFYPQDSDDYDLLKDALAKLKLSDPSFIFEPETKEALGRGYRCGFLGTLHVEIVSERLRREFGLNLVISTPSVVYKIIYPVRDQKISEKKQKEQISNGVNQKPRTSPAGVPFGDGTVRGRGKEEFIYSATDWPEPTYIKSTEEPWVSLEIITPTIYLSKLMEILKGLQGKYINTQYLGGSTLSLDFARDNPELSRRVGIEKAIIGYEVPLRGIIIELYDKIKSVSQGYASMNYKILGFRPGNLVKLEIWIAGQPEEAFSKIVAEKDAYREGKAIVEKLKEVLPPEQFSIALQAVVQGKVIARETIRARRKDVTGYLYGGDVTRKRKLLEKQKKGKKLLKGKGKVNVSQNIFLEIFKNR